MGRKPIINDEELVKLERKGVPRVEQARIFGVDPSAVTRAHERIRAQAAREIVADPAAARGLITGLEQLGLVAYETESINRGLLFQAGKFDQDGNPMRMTRKERKEVLDINRERTNWLGKTAKLFETLFATVEFAKFKAAVWQAANELGIDTRAFGNRVAELCELGPIIPE